MPVYVLREGLEPGVALYTRCEDELLCRAELLLLLDDAIASQVREKRITGYYDVDPTFTITEFKKSYRRRKVRYACLMAKRDAILLSGWPYRAA